MWQVALKNYHIRKMSMGSLTPPHILDIVKEYSQRFYDTDLPSLYTDVEWDKINSFIDHNRDMALTYVAMEQMRGKYLCTIQSYQRINGNTTGMLYFDCCNIVFEVSEETD